MNEKGTWMNMESVIPTSLEDTPELLPETSVALRSGADIEVMGYHEQAIKLLDYAEKRTITTAQDLKPANDDLSIISKLKKAMEAKKREYLEPLKVQTEAIRDTYNYLMAPILEADKITREKMTAYNTEQNRIRVEQEEINRLAEQLAQKQKELTGEIIEPGLVEVVPEAPKRVSTEMGTSGQRDNWKYEIIDVDLIPRGYMMPDTSLLNATAKAHHDKKLVPGVRFYCEKIIAVRAK